jgi:hypothetical protein
MKKIVTLNEEDLLRLIKKVINEQSSSLIGKTVNFYGDNKEKNFILQIKVKNILPDRGRVDIIPNYPTERKYRMHCGLDDPYWKGGFESVPKDESMVINVLYNKKFYDEVYKQFCKSVPQADFQKP